MITYPVHLTQRQIEVLVGIIAAIKDNNHELLTAPCDEYSRKQFTDLERSLMLGLIDGAVGRLFSTANQRN